MADFDKYLATLKDKIEELAKTHLKEYIEAAVMDGQSFVEKTKADLERWTSSLAKGELSKEDFVWLVKGKKDLAEMEALKQAGLSQVRMDNFRNSLLSLVTDTALEALL